MGFEPMNTGFADQRVSHFAIGALAAACLVGTRRDKLFPATTSVAPRSAGTASPSCTPETAYPPLRSRPLP